MIRFPLCRRLSLLFLLIALSGSPAAPAVAAADYSLTIAYTSNGARWSQTLRVQIVPAGDSLTVTLRDVKLNIQQAPAEHRATIEPAYGGYDGASAAVKIDERSNILSVGNVSSPAATDGRLPVAEADIRRIVGLCVLAMPATQETAKMNAGDSWPADYKTATPVAAKIDRLNALSAARPQHAAAHTAHAQRLQATRVTLSDITQKDGQRIGHFVFSYQARNFSHTRDVLIDLQSHLIIKGTAMIRANSDGEATTTTMTVERIE